MQRRITVIFSDWTSLIVIRKYYWRSLGIISILMRVWTVSIKSVENLDVGFTFSSSETVIFLNLVTTISCQITTQRIGFIGLLIILLILRLLVLKKMLSINASKEQKSVLSKSLRRKQITQNAGRTKLVESILIGNEIATILGNCPT